MKHSLRLFVLLLFAGLFAGTATAQTKEWKSDPIHSSVTYLVRHGVTPMMGQFKEFTVMIQWDDEKLENCSVSADLDPASVMMGNDALAKHLRGEDFFHVDEYKSWSFKSKEIQEDDGKYVAIGDLTVRGVTEQIAIAFEFLGTFEARGNSKAGFVAEFAIDRTRFGVNFDPDEKMIGKSVRIRVGLELFEYKG